MNISSLLAKLKSEASIVLSEKREFPEEGIIVYILESPVTFFPQASRHLWYNLVVASGQVDVEEEEIEAILRHFWHAEIDVDSWLAEESPNIST
jgi:hypothetical protein